MVEEWRPIEGYEGLYEVSDLGRVRSLTREVDCADGRTRKFTGRVLTPGVTGSGYHVVVLRSEGVSRSHNMHRLVATAFHPNPDNLPLVRHINDIGTDNHTGNLAWGTYSENRRDAVASGAYINQYANATHCINEHEFTPENTYISPSGTRHCRACRKRTHYERRRNK